MRILFVTPLLWKRLDRAVRRREEGEAFVLVALVIVAVVALGGLALDGALSYFEAQKLQRAADAAALAGVVWVPDQKDVADGRGKQATSASGYQVYRGDGADPDDGWTYDEVMFGPPRQRVTYLSAIPKENQYQVTLGKATQRYFLGLLGFGNYYIQRTATAQYSRAIKLGSSFNYLGNAGVLYDPSVNGANDDNQTYARYVNNRCDQANPPNPCAGVFWSNIGGTDWVHGNGDAYNPILDGQVSTNSIARWSTVQINTSSRANNDCDHTVDPVTWFTDNSPGAGNGFKTSPYAKNAGSCNAPNPTYLANYPPVINNDIHPDSGLRRNFGYEIGIQVDRRALLPADKATATSHTNVNVSIYDAALAPPDGTGVFGAGDVYNLLPAKSGSNPYRDYGIKDNTGKSSPETEANNIFHGPYNGSYLLSPFYPQRFAAATPYTGTVNALLAANMPDIARGVCPPPNVANPYPGGFSSLLGSTGGVNKAEATGNTWRRCISQFWVTDTTTIQSFQYGGGETGVGLNFGSGQPYRKNELRTRYTLYWPPAAPGQSSAYANVAFNGNKIGAFEVGDMSIRLYNASPFEGYSVLEPVERTPGFQDNNVDIPYNLGAFPVVNWTDTSGSYNAYCYIASLNPPQVIGTNPATGLPVANPRVGQAPANLIANKQDYGLTTVADWNDTQFVYVCPQSFADLDGTGVVFWANDYYWGMPFPSGQYRVVSNTIGVGTSVKAPVNNSLVQHWVDKSFDPSYYYKAVPSNVNYLDPAQECRISVGSAPGVGFTNTDTGDANVSPVDKLYAYGSPRMPYNAAYGDRINYYDPTTGKWQYWSRHGWRCNWDFDSDYDPRFNPLNPAGTTPLDTSGVPNPDGVGGRPSTNNGYSYYGNGRVEPFFHLTDWTFNAAGQRVLKPGTDGKTLVPGSTNAWVRPGAYMLHVQTYGGSGANRYSVKAEYENAQPVTVTLGYYANGQPITTRITPVPNVFGISTFSIFTNSQNPNNFTGDIIFDLAYIPPDYAGSTAILQIWDPGDVSALVNLSLRQPSPAGNRLDKNGKIAMGDPITVSVQACPYFLNNVANCKADPVARTKVDTNQFNGNGFDQFFNDQWVSLVFQIPDKQAFNQYLNNCVSNKVPEEACYYFQLDYEFGKGASNDNTTWQLLTQAPPVRLLK